MKSTPQKIVFRFFPEFEIAYSAGLAKALGSINAALLVGQLLYWKDKGENKDWIYKTMKEVHWETGLSRKQQDKAIAVCKAAGFLETQLKRIPPIRHFKLDMDKLTQWVSMNVKKDPSFCPKRTKWTVPLIQNTTEITHDNTHRNYQQRERTQRSSESDQNNQSPSGPISIGEILGDLGLKMGLGEP